MGKFRGFDSDEGWIKRRFAKIEKQMREDRAAKRLQSSTIGAGGITVKDSGAIRTLYSNGNVGAQLGPANVDGSGASIILADEDGSALFVVLRLEGGPDSVTCRSDLVHLTSKTQASRILITDTSAILASTNLVQLAGDNGVTIQHTTTGSAANTVLDAVTGIVSRSTSSLRYKQDVEDAEVDPAAVLNMQPRTWRDKAEVEKDPDTETRYVGFIAEELHELGLGQFVVYDTDGDPEAISYDRLTVALLAVLKDQEKRIAALEADDA